MLNNKLIFLLLLSVFFILTTCKKVEKLMMVKTGVVNDTTDNSAKVSGQIIDLGEGATEHGHCYAKTSNVTINDSRTQLGKPTGINGFTSQLTNLEVGAKYYVRAYLSNGNATVYGSELSFVKSSVTDIDGNAYKTITIGTQVWMAENLKTTKYRNGDLIGTTNPSTLDISNESTPKYQWVYPGNENNVAIYGRLYTWHAATDSRNVCPTGWHIPNDAEWTTLITNLGGQSVAGGKLKETGTNHWAIPNEGATNEMGFTALPGGQRNLNGNYGFMSICGFWWSSTEYSATNAWNTIMDNGSTGVDFNYYYGRKQDGFSVRCIRDF